MQPRRALRRDLLPADDGPRPLQGRQRHHRPPEGRRGAARRQRRAARLLARVGLPGALRRRGVRRSSCRAPSSTRRGRSPSASAPRSRPSTSATTRLHVTMSIGVAAFPESAADSDGVLGAADAALLRAKCARPRQGLPVHRGAGRRRRRARGRPGRPRPALRRLHRARRGRDGRAGHGARRARDRRRRAGRGPGDPRQRQERRRQAQRGAPQRRGGARLRQRALGRLGVPRGTARERHPSRGPSLRRVPPLRGRRPQRLDSVDELRAKAAKELDPAMVQRFTAMLRAEKAEHN